MFNFHFTCYILWRTNWTEHQSINRQTKLCMRITCCSGHWFSTPHNSVPGEHWNWVSGRMTGKRGWFSLILFPHTENSSNVNIGETEHLNSGGFEKNDDNADSGRRSSLYTPNIFISIFHSQSHILQYPSWYIFLLQTKQFFRHIFSIFNLIKTNGTVVRFSVFLLVLFEYFCGFFGTRYWLSSSYVGKGAKFWCFDKDF